MSRRTASRNVAAGKTGARACPVESATAPHQSRAVAPAPERTSYRTPAALMKAVAEKAAGGCFFRQVVGSK